MAKKLMATDNALSFSLTSNNRGAFDSCELKSLLLPHISHSVNADPLQVWDSCKGLTRFGIRGVQCRPILDALIALATNPRDCGRGPTHRGFVARSILCDHGFQFDSIQPHCITHTPALVSPIPRPESRHLSGSEFEPEYMNDVDLTAFPATFSILFGGTGVFAALNHVDVTLAREETPDGPFDRAISSWMGTQPFPDYLWLSVDVSLATAPEESPLGGLCEWVQPTAGRAEISWRVQDDEETVIAEGFAIGEYLRAHPFTFRASRSSADARWEETTGPGSFSVVTYELPNP